MRPTRRSATPGTIAPKEEMFARIIRFEGRVASRCVRRAGVCRGVTRHGNEDPYSCRNRSPGRRLPAPIVSRRLSSDFAALVRLRVVIYRPGVPAGPALGHPRAPVVRVHVELLRGLPLSTLGARLTLDRGPDRHFACCVSSPEPSAPAWLAPAPDPAAGHVERLHGQPLAAVTAELRALNAGAATDFAPTKDGHDTASPASGACPARNDECTQLVGP